MNMATEVRSAIPLNEDGVFEWDPSWDKVREYPIRIPCMACPPKSGPVLMGIV